MTSLTPIGSQLELALDAEHHRMLDEWFFCWHQIGGSPVEIDLFSGRPGRLGGIAFSGTVVDVYWEAIQRYLRHKVDELFRTVEVDIQRYSVEIRNRSLDEVSWIISGFCERIRRSAIKKDRILRGDGVTFPPEHDRGQWLYCSPSDVDERIQILKAIYCVSTINVGGREMSFNDLMTDRLTLVKKDGTVAKDNIVGSVQGTTIITMDQNLPVQAGDHLLRKLPNGFTEDFEVLAPNFQSGGSLSHWSIKTRRSDEPAAPLETVVAHITGDNARVSIHSVDHSTNTVYKTNQSVFSELRAAIAREGGRSAESEALVGLVVAMEKSTKEGSFAEAYQRFIAAAANHMTVVAPFLPALGKFFGAS